MLGVLVNLINEIPTIKLKLMFGDLLFTLILNDDNNRLVAKVLYKGNYYLNYLLFYNLRVAPTTYSGGGQSSRCGSRPPLSARIAVLCWSRFCPY